MKVVPLLPDSADGALRVPAMTAPNEFTRVLGDLSSALTRAQRAEDAFAAGSGSLQDAVYERARADVAISVATAAAGRVVQSVQSLLNMQV